jgi:hypothetical protein
VRLQKATAHVVDWFGSGAEPGHAERSSWASSALALGPKYPKAQIDKTTAMICSLIFNSRPPSGAVNLDFPVKLLQ